MTRLMFGKYKGELIENVPRSYLEWTLRECGDMPAWLALEIEQHLAWLDRPKPPKPRPAPWDVPKSIDREDIARLLEYWKRALAGEHKGDESAAAVIEAADKKLRMMLAIRPAGSGRSS